MMTANYRILFVVPLLSLVPVGCERSQAASGSGASSASAAQAAVAAPAPAKLTRIVFVGKKNACDCTRKAVDAGWTALQKALGTPATLPVEQLQSDTEAEKVEPYRLLKPFMALPAIYFLDDKDAILELMQGEVTAEQVTVVLGKLATAR